MPVPTKKFVSNSVANSFYLLTKKHLLEEISDETYVEKFKEAVEVHKYKTMQILLWTCDNKNGLGTDSQFLTVNKEFVENRNINISLKLETIKTLVRLGKWGVVVDMLKHNCNAKLRIFIFNEIKNSLRLKSVNCARYLPRNGEVANRIRGYLKLSPGEWRKVLVPLCSTQIFVMMSAGKWNEINYEKVPLHLFVKYYNAFFRHDKDRVTAYLESNQKLNTIILNIRNRATKPVKKFIPLEDIFKLNYISKPKKKKEAANDLPAMQ